MFQKGQFLTDKQEKVMDEKRILKGLKKLAALFVIVCLVIAIFSQHMFRSVTKLHKESVHERLEERAIQYQKSFLFKLDADLQTLRAMAGMIQESPQDDAKKLVLGLKQANEASDFVRLGYFTEENSGFRLSSTDEGIVSVSLENLPKEFRRVVECAWKGSSYCSEMYYDEELGYNVLAYATPVYEDGKIQGVLASDVSTQVYCDIFSSIDSVGDVGEAALVRNDGKILASTRHHVVEGFYNIWDATYLTTEVKSQFQQALLSEETEYLEFSSKGYDLYACVLPVDVFSAKLLIVDTNQGISDTVSSVVDNAHLVEILFGAVSIGFVLMAFWFVRRYNRYLLQVAYRDKLTGAYNKEKFLEILSKKWTKNKEFMVISINIRKFKFINELFGVPQSDALLQHICDILKRHIKEDEFFCRDTADTFLICMHELDEEVVKERLMKIFSDIKQVVEKIHSGYPIYFYCGCATSMDCMSKNDHNEELMSHVMLALSHAKKEQRISISFYDSKIHEQEKLQDYIENHMEQALKAGEYKMFLQPKMRLSDGTLSGAEALVRWMMDGKEMLFPDQFVPLLEQNRFCIELDCYMVEQACKQIREWLDAGLPLVPISVNQTKLLFYEEGYSERLLAITEKYQVSPKYITLEILEGLALENVEKLNECIETLRGYGFRISMDDFGSGYSSFNTLGNLKIDELKLDRAFMMQAQEKKESNQRKILGFIIDMAKKMDITTVAEGVETEECEQMLKELNCDYGQGYYYSKPISVEEFYEKFLKGDKTTREI